MHKKVITGLLLMISCTLQVFAQHKRDHSKEVKALTDLQDTVARNKRIAVLKAGSEEDFTVLLEYYFAKGMNPDTLIKIGVERFPKGELAYRQIVGKISQQKNANRKLEMLDSVRHLFPNRDYGEIYVMLTGDLAREGDFDRALVFLNKTHGADRMSAWAQLVWNNKKETSGKLEQVLDKNLTDQKIEKEEKICLLALKRYLLEKKQDYKQAVIYTKKLLDLRCDTSQYALDHYYYLLSKSGQYKSAIDGLEKAVVRETEDEDIKNEYKIAFKAVYPNCDVEAHLDSINKVLAQKFNAQYKSKVLERLVKDKAPDFQLLNTDGKSVTFAELEGKILVIDFWATWCGPCKASLPGMQILFNKYKQDSTVRFLFVHTYESPGNTFATVRDNARAFFKDHNYSLPLYIDLKNKESNSNKAAQTLKVGGIPHKLIIDREGFIRFNSVGFDGSTLGLVAELSTVIEELKKN